MPLTEKQKEYKRQYYAKPENREREKARAREYQRKYQNRPGAKEARLAKRQAKPDRETSEAKVKRLARARERYREPGIKEAKTKSAWLRRLKEFGMSEADYDNLLSKQGGMCALCPRRSADRDGTLKLFVDHCHKTGRVRGLLCHNCNAALGMLGDQQESVIVWAGKVAAYFKDDSDGGK